MCVVKCCLACHWVWSKVRMRVDTIWLHFTPPSTSNSNIQASTRPSKLCNLLLAWVGAEHAVIVNYYHIFRVATFTCSILRLLYMVFLGKHTKWVNSSDQWCCIEGLCHFSVTVKLTCTIVYLLSKVVWTIALAIDNNIPRALHPITVASGCPSRASIYPYCTGEGTEHKSTQVQLPYYVIAGYSYWASCYLLCFLYLFDSDRHSAALAWISCYLLILRLSLTNT